MFALGVSDHIMIAHSFDDPFFGPAQRLHGATYDVELEVRADALGPHDVVMDIGALRSLLRRILDELDLRCLDDHPSFRRCASTTERVAEHVGNAAAEAIAKLASDARPSARASLCVTVRESPVAYASYEREV
jgi:6-pyruvoyltetrahydropterin/6-carboxytetrahydropterin synthase